jgi:hypothetical protein
MEIHNELLPLAVVAAGEEGVNRVTQNARYRAAVCDLFGLRFHRVGGNGNCFFTSVCIALEATLGADNVAEHLATEEKLRASLVSFLRGCVLSGDELSERILIDIRHELNFPLQCSTRAEFQGVRIHNYHPSSIETYLEASAADGVWICGYHWPRALSAVASVCVAIVICGHDSVIYFGSGDTTIYLYKVFMLCKVRLIDV